MPISRTTAALVFALVAGIAIVSELAQTTVAARTGSAGDVGLDLIGGAAGVGLGAFLASRKRRAVALALLTAGAAIGTGWYLDTEYSVRDTVACSRSGLDPSRPQAIVFRPEQGEVSVDDEVTRTDSVTAFGDDELQRAPETAGERLGCTSVGGFQVSALLLGHPDTTGPGRILSLSSSPELDDIDFMIGQDEDALVLRVRLESGALLVRELEGVFISDELIELDIVFVDERADVFVDGTPIGSIRTGLNDGRHWRTDLPLQVGNEADGTRPFVGEIRRVTVDG